MPRIFKLFLVFSMGCLLTFIVTVLYYRPDYSEVIKAKKEVSSLEENLWLIDEEIVKLTEKMKNLQASENMMLTAEKLEKERVARVKLDWEQLDREQLQKKQMEKQLASERLDRLELLESYRNRNSNDSGYITGTITEYFGPNGEHFTTVDVD